MAKFTLSAVTTSGEVALTYFDAQLWQTGGYTFDESVNVTVDTASLTFSALKYRVENGAKVLNLPITALTYGSVIRLREHNTVTEYKVQSINYAFSPDNLQLQFTCLDRFQAEAVKIAVGYTITADTSDPNFLGAQSIDTWARKIIQETNLPWGYVNIDEANNAIIKQLAAEDSLSIRDDITKTSQWEELVDPLINQFEANPATLNNKVSFECSNLNAFAALKDLATQNELILCVDYENQNIYFIPQKNWWFKGYYFNPHINLQQMGLQGDGQNMATILNVTGGKDINDQEIMLVPSIPQSFEDYVKNVTEWESSRYYPGFFYDHSRTGDEPASERNLFATMAEFTPWFENKLIDTSFYVDKLISPQDQENIENILTNDLRIVNVPLVLDTRTHLKAVEEWVMKINEERIKVENAIGANVSVIDAILDEYETHTGNVLPACVLTDGNNNFWLSTVQGSAIHIDDNPVFEFDNTTGWQDISIYITGSSAHHIRVVNAEKSREISIDVDNGTGYLLLSHYETPSNIAIIPELDTFLNDEVATLDSAWQTLAKNVYLLREYWENGRNNFYCKFKKMGVVIKNTQTPLDTEMDEPLTASSVWSVDDSSTLGTENLKSLYIYFGIIGDPQDEPSPEDAAKITRSRVIQECANIELKMTEYWDAMRTAALQQGVYIPQTWNCVDILLQSANYIEGCKLYKTLLPLTKGANGSIYLNQSYGGSTNLITKTKDSVIQYRYFDRQRDALSPLITNNTYYLSTNTNQVISSNTQNYYQLVEDNNNRFWYKDLARHTKEDTVQLYKTKLKYKDDVYQYDNSFYGFIPATNEFFGPLLYRYWMGWARVPSFKELYIQYLANATTRGTTMYQLQAKHDEIWRNLYVTYPGIFSESTYENTDAATPMDLYFAAKAQLESLKQPEFSYNLTGIDLYTKAGQLMMWNVTLGDQVRIDYVESADEQQVVDAALKAQLYVTGINHSLRDDANYQFTVATRKATDTMVRRFAQLLTLGR